MRFRVSQATVIVAALIGGAAAGILFPEQAKQLSWLSEIFLRLIRSIIAPLLFGVLVKAIADAGGLRGLGRIGWRALVYFEVTTTSALLLGWATVTLLPAPAAVQVEGGVQAGGSETLGSLAAQAFPSSIFDAMARGDVLQILVFCILFGVAASAVKEKAEPVLRFADALTTISFEFTRLVMLLAPAAIFSAIASTVARSAREVIASLGAFVAAAWGAQLLFVAVVIGGSIIYAGVSFRRFWREVEEPFMVAFATTSSAAAMPKSLEAMQKLGVKREIYGIVTPLSLTLNLAGSCIHLAMCSFFAARAGGISLAPAEQVMMLLMLKLTSKGVAGIPRANFIILAGVFSTFGLPAEMLTILLGVDALIDPVRTSTNVLGHCAAPPVIEKWAFRTRPSAWLHITAAAREATDR